jgi:glycosyltransferase involved in cell wall biosynthesis
MDKPLSLLCVVEDPAISPSSRLRIMKHLPALRAAGIEPEIVLLPKGSAAWRDLLAKARACDAVLWQKSLFSQWDVLRLRRATKKLFYDIDDAVWMGKRNHIPYRSGKQARRFGFLVRFLDGALCGSPHLREKILSIRPKLPVALVPTSVPERPSLEKPATNAAPVVVWVGMGPNVAQVEAIEEELIRVREEHPFLLRIVSDKPPAFRSFVSWEFVPWSKEEEYEAVATADLGIMPLVDDGFTRGKCAYKALQYMACGLPVVASDVGVNREWVEASGSGNVVRGGEWAAALGRYLGDPSLRERTGRKGWETVQERFTDEIVGAILARTLREWMER